MLQWTALAVQAIERFAQEELTDGEFIRIARAYQCGGPRFQLTVDDALTQMDIAVPCGSHTVYVDEVCLGLLGHMMIDFHDDGFVFEDTDMAVC